MRLFGSEKLMGIFKSLGVPENEQIEHKMLSSAIEKAQKKIEGNNYGIRKNLLVIDLVIVEQVRSSTKRDAAFWTARA